MSISDNYLYKFNGYCLDTCEKILIDANRKISLTPKNFQLLLLFVENAGKLLSKNEIMEKVWAESFVEDSNLTFTIRQLRKLLDDDAHAPKFIETIPKRGYRFIANVEKSVLVEIEKTQIIESQTPVLVENIPQNKLIKVVETNNSNRKYVAVFLGLFILISLLVSSFVYRDSLNAKTKNFNKISFKRITTDGNTALSTISPDGKYIVFAKEDGGKQSLLVRQTEETKDIEVVSPQSVQFWGITISPDNKRIFYTAWETNKSDASLYQVPILGGTPQKVLEMIDSAVSFSPDGNKFAYFRTFNSANHSELLTANTDGSDVTVLATRKAPESFDVFRGSPAWSPDGNTIIAVGASTLPNEKFQLISYDVKTGDPTPLTEKKWTWIEQVSWLGNQTGLVMNAGEDSYEWKQIWHISYPDGTARKITNDLYDYVSVKPSTDSKILLTVQREQITNYFISPSSDIMNGKNILSETGKNGMTEGIAWSPDDKLILRYSQNNQDSIWQIDANGENKKQLTTNFSDLEPTVSADGMKIIFSSKQTGNHRLWQIDRNGENRKLLTNEETEAEDFANCSPNSEYCVYQKGWKKASIYRLSLATGENISLTKNEQAIRPAISPDGKLFAYYSLGIDDHWFISVAKLENGGFIKKFPISETAISRYLRWTPDSQNIAYVDTQNKVSNIILQPLQGEKTKQLTNFKNGEIFYFDWSRNGKLFAISRGTLINNAIAITNEE